MREGDISLASIDVLLGIEMETYSDLRRILLMYAMIGWWIWRELRGGKDKAEMRRPKCTDERATQSVPM